MDPYLECTRCKQPIVAETRVWLELDMTTGRYERAGTVPAADSQGEFPFGPDCAKHPNKPYKGRR